MKLMPKTPENKKPLTLYVTNEFLHCELLAPFWSKLDLGKMKFEKSSWRNLITLNLIFTTCVASTNQFRNRQKFKFVQLDFSNLIFQKIKCRSIGFLVKVTDAFWRTYVTLHWFDKFFCFFRNNRNLRTAIRVIRHKFCFSDTINPLHVKSFQIVECKAYKKSFFSKPKQM